MTTMEALNVSEEVKSAKKARTAATGALTRVANQLKKDLVLDVEGKYDFLKMDKFSIEEDAKKLQLKVETLENVNEAYVNAGLSVLSQNKVGDEIVAEFEDEAAIYRAETRKEATSILNLYKFEYTTALDRYLKNIEEEGKQEPKAPTLSQTEINKVKKKAETDKKRQLNRWSLIKTEWVCLIEQAEKQIEDTVTITAEVLLSTPVLIDTDIKIKALKEHWNTMQEFLETLWDVLDGAEVDQKEAERLIDFDSNREVKRLHYVVAEFESLSVVIESRKLQQLKLVRLMNLLRLMQIRLR